MHALLSSLGTDGDVLPFIGLGAALRARGHRVTIATAGSYSKLVAAHRLEFRELVSTETMHDLLANADFWHPIKTARFTAKWGARLIEPQYRLLRSLAETRDTVLVANPAIFAASLVHETMRCPLVSVILQPWMIYSAVEPPVMPVFRLPRWAPRFMHALYFQAIGLTVSALVGPTLNRVRRSLGLKPMRRIIRNWFSRQLVVGMFPDWFGPRQEDWPPQIKLVGFPRFDAVLNRALPPGLHEFLTVPKPTVVFTFGSGMMHGATLFDAVSRVCSKLNVQGIFINRFQSPSVPAHIFHSTFLPFREIFPECAAVVHHGGVGTTAEAFAAGTPQLILPLGFDQLDNGVRVKKLGAGLHLTSKHNWPARATPLREREINEIIDGLSLVLKAEYKLGAKAVGRRVREQDGLQGAADAIETLFRDTWERP
jgi:rhamnosyltransferase subunit B